MSFPASAPVVRVLVVDDSPAFRDGAHALIDETVGFEWIGEAVCGEDGIEQAVHLRPDLVLIDVRMPGIGGFETALDIASRGLPSVVVLITGAELPTDVPVTTAVEILAKHQLGPASLKRLWSEHGSIRSSA